MITSVPDGIFSNQKFLVGLIWEGLAMEDVVYYTYGHLVYFKAIWYILWSFGTYILGPFGIF
jgi:hypothetical protein